MHSCPADAAFEISFRQSMTDCDHRLARQFSRVLIFVLLFCALKQAAPGQIAPSIRVADSAVVEGNSGTTNLVFHLRLSEASGETVMVDYATRDITAQAGVDYSPSFGVALFPPGTTNLDVIVSVNGDKLNEADEV